MKKFLIILAVVMLATTISLIGCKTGTAAETTAAETVAGTATETTAVETAAETTEFAIPDKITIGWTPPDITGVFKTVTDFYDEGAADATKNGINTEVITQSVSTHTNFADQVAIIEDFISLNPPFNYLITSAILFFINYFLLFLITPPFL